MSKGSNSFVRSLHDLGLAAWFGGSLMGAVGLNGATAAAGSPDERLRLASVGWARWTPWQIGAIAVHTVGGLGLIKGNAGRLATQPPARSATVAKFVLTVAAAGASAYAGLQGTKVWRHKDEGAEGVTEPSAGQDPELAAAQRRLKLLQWSIPALTGAALVLGAVHGEQQRRPAGLIDTAVRAARSR